MTHPFAPVFPVSDISRSGAPPLRAAPQPVLALCEVTLGFGGAVALHDVSFAVNVGEIRLVLGPRGSGKSSLVNVIMGLYAPKTGEIVICGRAHARVPQERLADLGMARTWQHLALVPGLTVAQNIVSGLASGQRALARPDAAAQDPRVREVAEFLGLTVMLGRPVSTLTYGAQRRVDLARVLASAPRLLLLDAPFAGLTAAETEEMARDIRALRDRLGLSVIIVAPAPGPALDLADRVLVLEGGRVVMDGPADAMRRLDASAPLWAAQ